MRRHLPSLIAAFLLAVLIPALVQPAAAARRRKPSIGVRVNRLTPGTLQSTGTTVTVALKVTARNAQVGSVWVLGKVVGGATGEWVRLKHRRRGVYVGVFQVPGNPSSRSGKADIYVNVRTNRGDVQRIVKRLSMQAGNDSLPPPPPPKK